MEGFKLRDSSILFALFLQRKKIKERQILFQEKIPINSLIIQIIGWVLYNFCVTLTTST